VCFVHVMVLVLASKTISPMARNVTMEVVAAYAAEMSVKLAHVSH
jgi:hypothetical protein